MKNHELLDMIGEVNEDYVLAAGDNVVKPRFRWKTVAACAACAALVLCAWPVYRAFNPPLHDYTVIEGGAAATLEDQKAPAGGVDTAAQAACYPAPDPAPDPMPGGAYVGNDSGLDGVDGIGYNVPGQDVPVQEKAAAQYDNFLNNSGLSGSADWLPEWCGGIWIDNSYYPEAKLAVAIVDGFRTPELEAQIVEWCGGEVVFKDVKYSWSHLDQLMQPVSKALDGSGLFCSFGVDVIHNCLGVDLYSDGAEVPDSVLAELARLDPAGDAIRVRVFTQSMSTLTDEIVKAPEPPAPGGATHPVFDGAQPEPNVPAPNVENAEPEPTPTPIDDSERAMPAEAPAEFEELP